MRVMLDDAAPIVPGWGAGGVQFGTPAMSLRAAYQANWSSDNLLGVDLDHHEWTSRLRPLELQWLVLGWRGIIELGLNLLIGQVGHIVVQGSYAGRLWDSIGIGSPYARVLAVASAAGFEQCDEIEGGWIPFSPPPAEDRFPFGVEFLVADPSEDVELERLDKDELLSRITRRPVRAIGLWHMAYSMPVVADEPPTHWRLASVDAVGRPRDYSGRKMKG